MNKKIFAMVAVVVLAVPAVSAIIKPGFFSLHDDVQVSRVITMGKAIRNGQFPVRWVSDLGYGYGYPIYNFYGPLPYYVGGSLYSLGVDAILSTKIMFLAGIILGGLAMYILVQEYFGTVAGVVASVAYLYAPYHAVQIYVRGSVGEYYSLIFIPLLVLAVMRILSGKPEKSILVGSLGLSGLIVSHTIFGYVGIVFLAVFIVASGMYAYIKFHSLDTVKHYLIFVFGGLCLSAFFWLPAFTEMKYTSVSGQIGISANYRDHFVCIRQLWDSGWGYGGSAPGCEADGLSFKLGKFHILAALLSVLLWIKQRTVKQNSRNLYVAGLVVFVAAIILCLGISEPLWSIIPDFAYIQYPWRFLAFANFSLALLAGSIFIFIRNIHYKLGLGMLLVLVFILVNDKYFVPNDRMDIDSKSFENVYDLRWRASKISDEYLPPEFVRPQNSSEIALVTIPKRTIWASKAEVDTEIYSRYLVDSIDSTELTVQRVYFPGWHYKVNGIAQPVRLVAGLPQLHIESGHNVVELQFRNTPVRRTANIVSVITALGMLYFYYGRKPVS